MPETEGYETIMTMVGNRVVQTSQRLADGTVVPRNIYLACSRRYMDFPSYFEDHMMGNVPPDDDLANAPDDANQYPTRWRAMATGSLEDRFEYDADKIGDCSDCGILIIGDQAATNWLVCQTCNELFCGDHITLPLHALQEQSRGTTIAWMAEQSPSRRRP